jgi:hypothetical protein
MAESASDVLSAFALNNRWIIENYENLKKQYSDKWVVVYKNAVVDNDSDLKKLIARLKLQYSKVYNQIAVEYVACDEPDFILPQKESLADSFF